MSNPDYQGILAENPGLRKEIPENVASAISDYDNALLFRNLTKREFEDAEKAFVCEKSRLVRLIKPVNLALQKRGLPLIDPQNEEDLNKFSAAFVHFYFENRTR